MSDDLYRRWGETLRALRKERGLTLRRLGELAGVDHRNLCKFELGRSGIGDRGRMRIARVLGVRVEDIFAYPDEEAAEGESQ